MKKKIAILIGILLIVGAVGIVGFDTYSNNAQPTQTEKTEDCCKSCCSMD